MVKFAVVLTLLALLGSVSCQGDYASASPPTYASSQSTPAYPPSPSPLSPSTISYPPSPSPLSLSTISYPPSQGQPASPSVSPSQPTFPPPSLSAASPDPLTYPPNMGPIPPSESSPMYQSVPAYPPNPSPLSPSITYPPSVSPSQPTYPPLGPSSPSPVMSPHIYPPSPSPSINLPPSPSPQIPTLVTYPPSPSPLSSSQPTYTPSPSPIPSPDNFPPSPTPPTYPLSPSPSPPTYPPSPSPSPPTYPPSPSPSPLNPSPTVYPPNPSPHNYPPSPSPPTPGLSVGHYKYSCPNAEHVVRDTVKNAIDSNRGIGAGLIRLFFHDCFVQGCDASVLLNTTGSDEPVERLGAPNLTLRGFEVIDAAKAGLEEACPGVVSCADIIAFAGRDATYLLSDRAAADFDMPAGRYDGRVSLASDTVPNLPAPFFGLPQLTASFAAKGLSLEEMVTLSGAHTIGRSRCSSFSDRLPPNASDMDPKLAASLQKQCNSTSGGGAATVMQDFRTPDELDAKYYKNMISHDVLFSSDAALMASNKTASMVLANAYVRGLWESRFMAAMVKMGDIEVKTSADGEIRKKCWSIN